MAVVQQCSIYAGDRGLTRHAQRVFSRLAILASVFCLEACSPDVDDKKKDAVAGDVVVDTTVDGDAVVDATLDATNDVGVDSNSDAAHDAAIVDDVAETTNDGGGDTATDAAVEILQPACSVASDCDGKLSAKSCEELTCVGGVCGVAVVAGKCCVDVHCDDGKECTTDTCDAAKTTCLHTVVPNCCSGKVSLLKAAFEQGAGELVSIDGPTNGNVTWQPSTKRSHGGASSLYFGNACGTYDNSMSPETDCQPGPSATAVTGTLQSKVLQLPKDKSTQLHFWLWLDAEPPYSTTLPKGVCSPKCPDTYSCISVNGASSCVPEKDVFSVSVVLDGGATTKVFDSISIGKSTDGQWKRLLIDLDAFAGKALRLQWQFQTGTSIKNGFEGVFIDDVVLETVCAVVGTLCTAGEACLDDGSLCTNDACTFYANAPQKGFCFHDVKEGCCLVDANCDDGGPCTIDLCKSGACQHQPDSSKPACCKPSVELSEDFDSGVIDKWLLVAGNSPDVKWRIDPKGGKKGSQTLYFGDASYASYDDPALPVGEGPKGSICTPPAKLKIGTLFNIVSFQLNMETEWSYLPTGSYKNPPLAGQPKYDQFEVGVRQEGVPAAKIETLWDSDLIVGTTNGEWIEVKVPLDKWQGKTVSVCFSFDAGDDQVNDRAGVRVDDVLIQVACTKPECFIESECQKLSCKPCEAPVCQAGGCLCAPIAGCCQQKADCDDSDPCTADSCVSATCKNIAITGCCKVNTACPTDDVCKAPICDLDNHSCTTKPVVNCCKVQDDCVTEKLCITITCDVKANQCLESAVLGCCKSDLDCEDKDLCTKDNCIDLKCTHTPSGEAGCN